MSFLDTVRETGKTAADKARMYADIANLKNKVSGNKTKIKKAYASIGEKYYAEMGSEPGADYVEECDIIRQAQAEIEDLEEQIEAIKASN